jgi:hypothetical protein
VEFGQVMIGHTLSETPTRELISSDVVTVSSNIALDAIVRNYFSVLHLLSLWLRLVSR